MLNISSLNFRSIMPIITIGKYGEICFSDNNVGDTNTANRLVALKGDAYFSQGFLKQQFNRGIDVRLGLLPQSCLATSLSTSFIKLTKATNLIKLVGLFLPRLVAIPRAIPLITLACANGWLSTYRAYIRLAFSKACQLLTLIRAIALRWLGTPAIKWVVFLTAIITKSRHFHPHITIITQKQIEKKYCEIAAKRCCQGVFNLNV